VSVMNIVVGWTGRFSGRVVMWEDRKGDIMFSGVPFIALGSQTLECRSGPQRHVSEVTRNQARMVSDLILVIGIVT
jgi:hypothetical protein